MKKNISNPKHARQAGPSCNPVQKNKSSSSPDATLAARKAKILELLAQDRQKLLTKLPFTGSLVMRLDLVPVSDERLPTAATDGDRIFVDIDFYAQLTAEERLFVLAHEVWHCALLHFLRRGDRNQELFNIAADLEIHFLLTDEGLKAPFVLPHDPNWKGLSAEEIYERLKKGKPQSNRYGRRGDTGEGRESEHIKGQGGGQGFDKHLEKNDGAGEAGNDDRRRRHGLSPRLPLRRRASRTRAEPADLLHGRLRRLPRPRPRLPRDVAPHERRRVRHRLGDAGEVQRLKW